MTDQALLEDALAAVDAERDATLARLFALMRIPSISTDPSYRAECRAAAELLRAELEEMGFAAQLAEPTDAAEGLPSVIARAQEPEDGRRRALFYGHFDVQPVDPLALWDRPPFEPEIVTLADGRRVIHGRGASDDKGQLTTFLAACRAWRRVAGREPLALSFLLEGEEESGSRSLDGVVEAHRETLAADIALICDTEMWGDRPAITASLRGFAGGEVRIRAANRDLHSGAYGGAARNPIHVLCDALADLRDAEGRVTLPGFYDGVSEPPEDVRAAWRSFGARADALLEGVGLSVLAGESGRSPLELVWARPTAEVNGIAGGYAGPGFKTVIPAEATAKVSFRLVGAQDHKAVWAAFEAHVRARLPEDCEVAFTSDLGAPAVATPYDGPDLRAAAAALEAEWGRETAIVGGGGSIPAAGALQARLGLAPLLIGFAREDDQVHAPNEKYDLESFEKGARSWVRVLAALAARPE